MIGGVLTQLLVRASSVKRFYGIWAPLSFREGGAGRPGRLQLTQA